MFVESQWIVTSQLNIAHANHIDVGTSIEEEIVKLGPHRDVCVHIRLVHFRVHALIAQESLMDQNTSCKFRVTESHVARVKQKKR